MSWLHGSSSAVTGRVLLIPASSSFGSGIVPGSIKFVYVGVRSGFLPSQPYFGVCVRVSVFGRQKETSLRRCKKQTVWGSDRLDLFVVIFGRVCCRGRNVVVFSPGGQTENGYEIRLYNYKNGSITRADFSEARTIMRARFVDSTGILAIILLLYY